MSRSYSIGCKTCLESLWIGQGYPKGKRYIYKGEKYMAALELFHSGFHFYVWKRLLTISAEDCYGAITTEIWALYQAFLLIREKIKEGNPKEANKGRLFITKAVIFLCIARKCRDADHISNLFYDLEIISPSEMQKYISDVKEPIEMPAYVFDCHTPTGKRLGKTRKDFFKDEYLALNPKAQGEFDKLLENLSNLS